MKVFGKKTLILAGLLALSAAGCGRMADLESPARETERAPRSSRAKRLTVCAFLRSCVRACVGCG